MAEYIQNAKKTEEWENSDILCNGYSRNNLCKRKFFLKKEFP
jgi:hypothetical protein